MTSLLIHIKHRCPLIWRATESVNGALFALRYPKFDLRAREILCGHSSDGFEFSVVETEDIGPLSAFLNAVPASRLDFFAPHPFDEASLMRLHRNPGFMMMKITRDGAVAGYFFLRCFFIGKAFHGLIVDEKYSGRGLGREMWALSSKICVAGGIRMYATVSEYNVASLISAEKGTDVTVRGRLDNGYIMIECKSRTENA